MPTPGAKLILGSSVAAYVNHLRRGMPRMEAEACIRELKIQKLEIDRAERMGQLMHTELVQAFITEQIGAWRIELEALPARLSRDRAERSRINAEVEKVIDRIVAKAEALMAKLAVEEAEGAA